MKNVSWPRSSTEAGDRFEQYLIDTAWREGIRDAPEVERFISSWRDTNIARRHQAWLNLQAALSPVLDGLSRGVMAVLRFPDKRREDDA